MDEWKYLVLSEGFKKPINLSILMFSGTGDLGNKHILYFLSSVYVIN